MEGPLTDCSRADMAVVDWARTTTFRSRLAALRGRLQAILDQRSVPGAFQPRLPVTLRLSVDDLARLLPPAEGRLLAHLRARKPLGGLVGVPGFRSRARLNATLQTLLSRIQVYCGSVVRHRLMQPYDRPGHWHHRRVGRPRTLIRREQLPALTLWAPVGVVVLGSGALVVGRNLLMQRPAAAGLSMLLPHRDEQRRSDLPRSQRAPDGTVAVSWPELLARAAPWLSPLTS